VMASAVPISRCALAQDVTAKTRAPHWLDDPLATPPTSWTDGGRKETYEMAVCALRRWFTPMQRRTMIRGLARLPAPDRHRNLMTLWVSRRRGSMSPRKAVRMLAVSGHLVGLDSSSSEEEDEDDQRAPPADAGSAMATTEEARSARSRSPRTHPRATAAPLAARDRSQTPPSRPAPLKPLTPTKAPAEKRAPGMVPTRAARLVAKEATLLVVRPSAKPRALTITAHLAVPSPRPTRKGQTVANTTLLKPRPSAKALRA
jgi:hypothetical protein